MAEPGVAVCVDFGSTFTKASLVDLGLPDIDGIEVIRRIRKWSPLPILVLSARGQENDKIAALDWQDRELVRAVAAKIYGPRGK